MGNKFKQRGTTWLLIFALIATRPVLAQEKKWEDVDSSGYYKREVIQRNGYTLFFISKDSLLNPETKHNMIETFFTVYPAEVKRFNPKSTKTVTFLVSTDYEGIAATYGAYIKFNQRYLKRYPQDYDVVTHEVMHVVQGYGETGEVPGWITEGIADYARYTFGVNNDKAAWILPDYKPGQNYTDAYKVTARFFVWLANHTRKDIIDQINRSAREHTYAPEIWVKLTGKSLDDLWYLYITDPKL
jgi:hypothetical protein